MAASGSLWELGGGLGLTSGWLMAAGWLAEGLAGCWLAGWQATGTPGAERIHPLGGLELIHGCTQQPVC